MVPSYVDCGVNITRDKRDVNKALSMHMSVKRHNNLSRKTSQNVYNKSPSCKHFCNVHNVNEGLFNAMAPPYVNRGVNIARSKRDVNKALSMHMCLKGHNNLVRTTSQNVYNKSPSCKRFCKGNVKKGFITRDRRDLDRALNTRIKHGANKKLVTQYVYNKEKTSKIDGTLDISCHMPMLIGRDYDMNKTIQPKVKVFNNKGG